LKELASNYFCLKMSEQGGVIECFRPGGLIKMLETFCVFTCVIIHRIGNTGWVVYFGAADLVLDRKDVRYPVEADAEIVGLGGVTAFLIITPMLLLAYAIEGRKSIQAMKLDAIFCFIGAGVLIAGGGMSCFAWNNHLDTDYNVARPNYEVGGALGVLTTLTGVLYLVDFFYVMYQNAILTPSEY